MVLQVESMEPRALLSGLSNAMKTDAHGPHNAADVLKIATIDVARSEPGPRAWVAEARNLASSAALAKSDITANKFAVGSTFWLNGINSPQPIKAEDWSTAAITATPTGWVPVKTNTRLKVSLFTPLNGSGGSPVGQDIDFDLSKDNGEDFDLGKQLTVGPIGATFKDEKHEINVNADGAGASEVGAFLYFTNNGTPLAKLNDANPEEGKPLKRGMSPNMSPTTIAPAPHPVLDFTLTAKGTVLRSLTIPRFKFSKETLKKMGVVGHVTDIHFEIWVR
jgi:hypothetical protein